MTLGIALGHRNVGPSQRWMIEVSDTSGIVALRKHGVDGGGPFLKASGRGMGYKDR